MSTTPDTTTSANAFNPNSTNTPTTNITTPTTTIATATTNNALSPLMLLPIPLLLLPSPILLLLILLDYYCCTHCLRYWYFSDQQMFDG